MNINRLLGVALLVTAVVIGLPFAAAAQQQQDLAGLQGQLGQAQSNRPQIRADLDRAAAAVAAGRTITAQAQQAYSAAKAVADQMYAVAWAQFQAAPAYRAAVADLQNALASGQAAEAGVLKALAGTDAYRRAAQAVAAAQDRLQTLRDRVGPGAPAVVAASEQWMDAKNQVERLKRWALAADPAVQNAPREVARRQAAVDAMREEFAAQMPGRPDYAAALAAVDLQRKLLDAALADQQNAQASQASLQSAYDQQNAWMAQVNATLRALQNQTAGLQSQLSAVQGNWSAYPWGWQPVWYWTSCWPAYHRFDNGGNDGHRGHGPGR